MSDQRGYKEWILELINKLDNEEMLKTIYSFVKNFIEFSKVEKGK